MELDSEDCLRQVMTVRGVLGTSLIDCQSGLEINSTGRKPSEDGPATAAGVTSVVTAAIGGAPFASIGIAQHLDDVVVTAGNGYHLLHFVGRPESCPESLIVLYVWLDRIVGNLAMTQRHIQTLTDRLVAAR